MTQTNLLRTGMAALATGLKAYASDAVVYVQGSTRISLQATPGKSQYDVEHAGGVLQGVLVKDWIVSDADLAGLVPTSGDRIEYGASEVDVVQVVGGAFGCWEWIGLEGTLRRVHTKRLTSGQ